MLYFSSNIFPPLLYLIRFLVWYINHHILFIFHTLSYFLVSIAFRNYVFYSFRFYFILRCTVRTFYMYVYQDGACDVLYVLCTCSVRTYRIVIVYFLLFFSFFLKFNIFHVFNLPSPSINFFIILLFSINFVRQLSFLFPTAYFLFFYSLFFLIGQFPSFVLFYFTL